MTTDTDPGCGVELLPSARVLISGFVHSWHRVPKLCVGVRGSWPGATEHQQIIGDDPEPDPALHPALPAVPAPPQTMTALKRADPSFTPRAPTERRAGHPGGFLAGLLRQHDVSDSTVLCRPFIGSRGDASIGAGQVRRVAEQCDVTIQCWRPEGAVRLAAPTDRVVGDEL